ncbi:MAG: hypothetical protein HY903_20540 [Deltaproteobacteria bacterium]|nr:hypothetical protein [Deltaproteobacteria bacterium]
MTARRAAHLAALVGALIASCGGETALLVRPDVGTLQVPAELDVIHVALSDGSGPLIGRNFDMARTTPPYELKLLPGERTPWELTVQLFGFLGTRLVATSTPIAVSFGEGDTRTLDVTLTRVP